MKQKDILTLVKNYYALDNEISEKIKKSLFWKMLEERLNQISKPPIFLATPENNTGLIRFRGRSSIDIDKSNLTYCIPMKSCSNEKEECIRISVEPSWCIDEDETTTSINGTGRSEMIDIPPELIDTDNKQKILNWFKRREKFVKKINTKSALDLIRKIREIYLC